MSITIDDTETAELRRALLEDLPGVARRFEDVAQEDAARLRWCLWQELVLLRALGWRGEVFEHERELDGACLLGVQQLFRRANGVLAAHVASDDEQVVRVLEVCEPVLTAIAAVSTPELERRLARRPYGETELLMAASTVSRADAEVLRRQLVQMAVARLRRGDADPEEGLGWVLDDLRPHHDGERSSYLLTAPAAVIARTLTDATHDACSRLRVVLSCHRGRGSVLVALSAVGLCARLCERVVQLSEVAAEGGDAA
jgi:hypothetical protein